MTWYSASLIVSLETDEVDGPFTVFENVYLVEAEDRAAAREKADRIGRQEEVDDDTLTLNGQKARYRFVGLRKLVQISNLEDPDPDASVPAEGAEITYSQFSLQKRSDLQALISGREVEVIYIE